MNTVKLKKPIEVQRDGALTEIRQVEISEPKVAFARKARLPFRTIVENESGRQRIEVINDQEALFEWVRHLTGLSSSELEALEFPDYRKLCEEVLKIIGPLA